MPVTVISTNTIVSGTAYAPAAAGDDLIVLPDVTLMSTNSTAVVTNFADVTAQIDGTLIGFTRAITFDLSATSGHVFIGATGSVRAFNETSNEAAIVMFGADSGITNHGEIRSPETICLYMGGAQADVLNTGLISGTTGVQLAFSSNGSRLANYGTITGSNHYDGEIDSFEGRGVLVQSANAYVMNAATGSIGSSAVGGSGLWAEGGAGGLVFDNFGQVWAAEGIGIDLHGVNAGQAQIRVQNSGTISGLNGSYRGSENADALTNRGQMLGDIDLDLGADRFDNREGRIEGDVLLGLGDDLFDNLTGTLNGIAYGGDGNDQFRGNTGQSELFYGGAGSADQLDFRYDIGVVVALDLSFENDGAAFGDTYSQFENVFGSLTEADRIRGNSSANYIFSGGGNDVLDGAEGHDTLRGGNGRDTLTGGLGNDTFRFVTKAEAGDVINDFSSAATGNNDRFQITGAAFGGGLAAGTLTANRFQSRADNLAQDADDRFIFRTTDKTLWFDADGNGAGAALMIADLQASAVVTNLDILII